MHHPDRVIVNLTGVNVKITLRDGTSGQSNKRAGHVGVGEELVHAGENISGALWEIIAAELEERARKRPWPKHD